MMFDLPNHQTLYQALITRDPGFEGRAFVCVRTTGIFCRLTCPARSPKPENCTFLDSTHACLEAGFRPCKRCHPLGSMAAADPAVTALMAALEQAPDRRWTEADVTAMGFDASTVRRSFKRHFGMTFLEMARQRRLRGGFQTLAEGGSVIAAQLDAGFDSPSAFRAAFARLLGCAPGHLKGEGLLLADWIATPLGDMIAIASQTHLHLLEFMERKALKSEVAVLARDAKGALGVGCTPPVDQLRAELEAFFKGQNPMFETPVALGGTAFSRQVWHALRRIPAGETRSYSDVARAIGRPSAVRAVARANGANPLALVVPCHRVIGADGALTGYGGGLWRKQRLLEIERGYRVASQPAAAARAGA